MKIRRLLALVLALMFTMGMMIPAHATSYYGDANIATHELTATLDEDVNDTGDVDASALGIEVTWNDFSATLYKEEVLMDIWDPATLTYSKGPNTNYDSPISYSVDISSQDICTVANRSATPITVTAKYTPSEAVGTNFSDLFTVTCTDCENMAAATVGELGGEGTIRVVRGQSVDDFPYSDEIAAIFENSTGDTVSLGTITLSIAAAS